MLATNVLCVKKKKKKSYCIANLTRAAAQCSSKDGKGKRSADRGIAAAATMLQITEDTPPDMLTGAMDLTVHLPNGRSAKMSAERSTPMMDLLVQITNHNHLQLSGYTLQALGMAPSSGHSDKVLPFKPNTPIGVLETQHIRVVPKPKMAPAVPKNVPPGHQPFESTFRLKVHLPRNQLYVTRVSQSVHLEAIMRKVCEEKNLDPLKYEFRHPGNLDRVLDPKLTVSDYQITEVYVVVKGTVSLNQAFSSSDIMALRKEEERKQMHNKTGGGVFNLIFRRGKSTTTGSLSSDNRSISPAQSDDSRSVTPPSAPPPVQVPPPEPPADRPKPPQRKRRPAPKPPQIPEEDSRNGVDANRISTTSSATSAEESRKTFEENRRNSEDSRRKDSESSGTNSKPSSAISDPGTQHLQHHHHHLRSSSEPAAKKIEDAMLAMDEAANQNGLTICHSRNSSDSSGYHEASILSDNCANNTSLPRNRPKSTVFGVIGEQDGGHGENGKMAAGQRSQSTSNLNKMAAHSKSTSSLAFPNRKKKSAPPPPPRTLQPAVSESNLQHQPQQQMAQQAIITPPSPVVASHQHPPPQNVTVDAQPPEPQPVAMTPAVEETVVPPAVVAAEVVPTVEPAVVPIVKPAVVPAAVALTVPHTTADANSNGCGHGNANVNSNGYGNRVVTASTKSQLPPPNSTTNPVPAPRTRIKPPTPSPRVVSATAFQRGSFRGDDDEEEEEAEEYGSRMEHRLSRHSRLSFESIEEEEVATQTVGEEEEKKLKTRVEEEEEYKYSREDATRNSKLSFESIEEEVATQAVGEEEKKLKKREEEGEFKYSREDTTRNSKLSFESIEEEEVATQTVREEETKARKREGEECRYSRDTMTRNSRLSSESSEEEVAHFVEKTEAKEKAEDDEDREEKQENHKVRREEKEDEEPVQDLKLEELDTSIKQHKSTLAQLQNHNVSSIFTSPIFAASDARPTGSPTKPHPPVRPPEIIAVIPKAQKRDSYNKSMLDSHTRKRGFQIGSSLLDQATNSDEEPPSLTNSGGPRSLDYSSFGSVASALNAFRFVDEIEDVDVDIFRESPEPEGRSVRSRVASLNELHGIHGLEEKGQQGAGIPGRGLRKWRNFDPARPMGVIGNDTSCSDSDSVPSVPPSPVPVTASTARLNQQRAADEAKTKQKVEDRPKPQEISKTEEKQKKAEEAKLSADITRKETIPTEEQKRQELRRELGERLQKQIETTTTAKETKIPPLTPNIEAEILLNREAEVSAPAEVEEIDSDWQYHLPSPPKAFRDSSPEELFRDPTHTTTDFSDSIVTNPKLFEKLNTIKGREKEEEKETVFDLTSVVSEEEAKPIFNTLSLENLEKRKSLVYNRELSTSLKSTPKAEEEAVVTVRKAPAHLQAQNRTSTLPNFKITTYDNPKKNIDIFEDESVHSNRLSSFRSSTENINVNITRRKSSLEKTSPRNSKEEDFFRRPSDSYVPPTFYRQHPKAFVGIGNSGNNSSSTSTTSPVYRSESFSWESKNGGSNGGKNWAPTRPVTRSKSQVVLNKYNGGGSGRSSDSDRRDSVEEGELSKSSSLYDVSGLHSLEVMRMIQNKLNTPTSSMEQLNEEPPPPQPPQPVVEPPRATPVPPEAPPKTYRYRPPSINMGTWSDRPKVPVNVKDDPDYKFGGTLQKQQPHPNNNNNNTIIRSNNTIEVRNRLASANPNSGLFGGGENPANRNVTSIKVNGSHDVPDSGGNLVIKIGERRPLGDINKNQRPHSVAFSSSFDISRVPIVRSVELKKPFKDHQQHDNNNTSVTQIYGNSANSFKSNTLGHTKSNHSTGNTAEFKPATFKINGYGPVVRGFNSDLSKRMSWSQPGGVAASTPFSSTAVNVNVNNPPKPPPMINGGGAPNPPPPPKAPKSLPQNGGSSSGGGDVKDQLLQAIRDFGGKKGLKSVKGS